MAKELWHALVSTRLAMRGNEEVSGWLINKNNILLKSNLKIQTDELLFCPS